MADWLSTGLEDDMRPRMFEAALAGRPFALATIVEADGGPRPVGSQMVVTPDAAWGFLSGGCIEADVALHARDVLAQGTPRRLVYGQGSPFIDMRLPCGGRLDLLVERVAADDPAVAELRALTAKRIPALWESDGVERRCTSAAAPHADFHGAQARLMFHPYQRLAVVGTDPFAIAIAALGDRLGWETRLLGPFADGEPPFGLHCDKRPIDEALRDLAPDAWTALAVATHDMDVDEEVLVPALRSAAGYVGVLGSRRRLPERLARLREAGLAEAQVARLHAPLGLPIRARSPWEVAVAVTGEIIACRNEALGAP